MELDHHDATLQRIKLKNFFNDTIWVSYASKVGECNLSSSHILFYAKHRIR